ncbi:Hsp20/alpha crystallin family protein [Calidifontimicrobium sp. SYSU G02091]|uniref:Hsp20/alpha crystallin family protein n=1 Tax=Azohydromonas TaxID=312063 RepID=UPI000E64C127|nr:MULTISPECIES: Hsp20/alpha crystallin family protein [Azohydromonas]MCI1191025.1 Hsp20/alpha crystallin family protein [Calidifontimicrobium sp. SYSU G02091]
MKMSDIRQSFGSLWDTVAEGWDRLRERAAGALTRYRPGAKSNLPARDEIDDASYVPNAGWAMLGGDVFEDERRVVVRLEVPGMDKRDFDIEVFGDTLVVRGEKRFEREDTEGRWRVLQCAYGAFQRQVPLPVPVKGDEARATYRNGVLRIELPKQQPSKPRVVQIRVG